ncbi:MAG TPA: HNH endonuclease signature motif containing protein [Aggregatilineales bacterium]|nr:HNH endonuclease signature motif containing protein [Aggregatilineales bacterium]
MAYIPKILRQQVIERAHGLCEYCQTSQLIVIALQIDHVLPIALGGQTNLDNLCLACEFCNGHKNDKIQAPDPKNDTMQPLFNPRTQKWQDHFRWDETGTIIVGLTAIGRATIEKLRMNDSIIIQAREFWILTGLHPPK